MHVQLETLVEPIELLVPHGHVWQTVPFCQVPLGQTQEEDPASDVLFAGHKVHVVAFAVEYVPVGQVIHVEPVQNFPALQMQNDDFAIE